jgi:RHS repeat-associated protein
VDGNADLAVDFFEAEVLSARDFYLGACPERRRSRRRMVMPERSFSTQAYRYGFNGKEFDSEWKGEGNSYDYGFRVHDARLGRFLSVDPLAPGYPWYTPYQFAGNKAINSIDLDGAEPKSHILHWKDVPGYRLIPGYGNEGRTTLHLVEGHYVAETSSKFYINQQKYQYWDQEANSWQDFDPTGIDPETGLVQGMDMKTLQGYAASMEYLHDGLRYWTYGSMAMAGGFIIVAEIGIGATATWLAEELGEEVFESLTGIPVIIDPVDIAQHGLKKAFKKAISELCFVSGTLVLTVEGLKPIEEIAIEDSVLARNSDIKKIRRKVADTTFSKPSDTKFGFAEPISIEFYSQEEIEAQKRINEKLTEGIIVYSPLDKGINGTMVDYEEITPFTWSWIDFQLTRPDGTLSKISLRRPHWWIIKFGVDNIGKMVYLNLPDLRIRGWAIVTRIRANQLDTRFWDEKRKGNYVCRPIIGKFEHESNDVYYLYFGENINLLAVTGSHPIWSEDNSDWVRADLLKVGEKVKTKDGDVVLRSREKQTGRIKVFNLEIYKEHNFLVGSDKILVHNTCWKERLNKFMEYVKSIDPKDLTSQAETIKHLENVFTALDKTRTDERVIKLVGKSNVADLSDGTKLIRQFGDGNYTKVYLDGGFEIYRADKLVVNKMK